MYSNDLKKIGQIISVRLIQNAYKSGMNHILPLVPEDINANDVVLRFLNKITEEEMPLSIKINNEGSVTLYKVFSEGFQENIHCEVEKFKYLDDSFKFESLSKLFKDLITENTLKLNLDVLGYKEKDDQYSDSPVRSSKSA